MNELDEVWSMMLAEKLSRARASGRDDIADYLVLKQSNDLLRQTGVDWLFSRVIEYASEVQRSNPHVLIEREEPHEFAFRGARYAGSLLRVRLGIRSLTVEAGWTRIPDHGFMRGGILAGARMSHFGMPKEGADLVLEPSVEVPSWKYEDGRVFDSLEVQKQVEIVLAN